MNYNELQVAGGVTVKMWTKGVPIEAEAQAQLANAARLPIVFKHIAAMPDVHLGIGHGLRHEGAVLGRGPNSQLVGSHQLAGVERLIKEMRED